MQGGTKGVFARDAAPQGGFAANPFAAASTPSANQNPFAAAAAAPANRPNPFASPSAGAAAPAFGQPSAMGQKPNPFASAGAPAFGQPSQLGAAGPAFGKPSQLGAAGPAFGQPSQMGASGSAFGQPSALGQKPNPFAAAASTTSGFGQVAAQNPSNAPNPFAQPSTLGQKPNPFAAPSAPAAAPANPFGQPSQPSNVFAQAKTVPLDTSKPNPFAQAAQTGGPSPFGSAPKNAFGQPAPSGNPFVQQQQPQQQPAAAAAAAAQSSGQEKNPYPPNSTKQHPALSSYSSRGADGRLATWHGQPVVYKWKVGGDKYEDRPPASDGGRAAAAAAKPVPGVRNADGSWRRIFFPDGPPAYNADTEPEDPASQYTDAVRAAYARMAAAGRFEGDMPEVPPMREDCAWAF